MKIAVQDTIPCTGCGACRGCPMEIRIPEIFEHLNAYIVSGDSKALEPIENMPGDRQPRGCVGCEECLGKCPEHIDIPGWMLKTAKMMESIGK